MEIDLQGRRFTWSNEPDNPMLMRMDIFFGTPEWHLLFPNSDLQALSTLGSDHCPPFLSGDVTRQNYKGFRFESYWINMQSFTETMQAAWNQPVNMLEFIYGYQHLFILYIMAIHYSHQCGNSYGTYDIWLLIVLTRGICTRGAEDV